MRHRLLGIVIGSRATAVAIIFHYYCYRSAFPTMPPPPGLAFFLLLPPTDIVTTCGVLRRRIEITRVNLTFDLISENRSLPILRYVETSAIKKFCELVRGSFITQDGMARAILRVGSIHLGRFLSEFRWTAGPSRRSGSNLIAKNSLCVAEKLPSFRSLYTRPSLPCGGLTRDGPGGNAEPVCLCTCRSRSLFKSTALIAPEEVISGETESTKVKIHYAE
ncbi:hypothetical protein ALC57_17630 [Trachymyrmex cornetzi]|uniref:Uncharacterized protein n=1 Tax=Trachymyrmex cornetzi TaxID=471704 RepID=A0A151ITC9_9HYME|nr:hypothetical protein ALC57_17630 [Trachymyrmex cornetzi]